MTIERETHYRLDSRLGDIELTVQGEVVTALRFSDLAGSGDSAALPAAPARFREVPTAWFEGRGSGLEIVSPELAGTLFQQQVWRALRDIARGQRVSYRQLAKQPGTPSRSSCGSERGGRESGLVAAALSSGDRLRRIAARLRRRPRAQANPARARAGLRWRA